MYNTYVVYREIKTILLYKLSNVKTPKFILLRFYLINKVYFSIFLVSAIPEKLLPEFFFFKTIL